jgi:hypothetical protein
MIGATGEFLAKDKNPETGVKYHSSIEKFYSSEQMFFIMISMVT